MPLKEPLIPANDVNGVNVMWIFLFIFLLPGKKGFISTLYYFWSLI